jgi:hypothetical protein
MVTPFPTFEPSNVTSLTKIFNYTNVPVPEGSFGLVVLVMVFLVSFLSSSKLGFSRTILASLTVTFIVSVFLAVSGLINQLIPSALLVFMLVAFFLVGKNNS